MVDVVSLVCPDPSSNNLQQCCSIRFDLVLVSLTSGGHGTTTLNRDTQSMYLFGCSFDSQKGAFSSNRKMCGCFFSQPVIALSLLLLKSITYQTRFLNQVNMINIFNRPIHFLFASLYFVQYSPHTSHNIRDAFTCSSSTSWLVFFFTFYASSWNTSKLFPFTILITIFP